MKSFFLHVWILGIFVPLHAQTYSEKALKAHIEYLASDKLDGRAPGEKGELLAAKYIAKQFKTYGLTAKGTKGYFQPFTYKENPNPHASTPLTSAKERKGQNVIAYLDNQATQTIVIGAHYDHLGHGDRSGSLDPNPEGKIHNGADDNASGTAGLLELARYFSSNKVKEGANFLFIAFSAEEAGLIGSKYFVEHPTLDLKTVQMMINMDMIGRLNVDTRQLMLGGTGTAENFEKVILEMNGFDFKVVTDSSGVGPSDHTSFYLKQIPVLHFFTGAHNDYHKPSDDANLINYAGEVDVLTYITRVAEHFASSPRLKYLQTRQKDSGAQSSFKVTLGVIPDYAWSKGGLRLDGVTEGKPAAKAGLKAGDIILKLGDMEITDIQVYMKALGKFEKGQSTTVKVHRGEEVLEFPITF